MKKLETTSSHIFSIIAFLAITYWAIGHKIIKLFATNEWSGLLSRSMEGDVNHPLKPMIIAADQYFYLAIIILLVVIYTICHKNIAKTPQIPFERFKYIGIGIWTTILLFCIFIRLPFYFDSTINWDESTYTLMGQDILNGHLPYTNYWENKPPLAFLCYSFFIFIFGKSIVAIRLGGTLFIILTSYFVYKTSKNLFGHLAGYCAAIITIVYSSTFISSQATMTETLAILPLSAMIYQFSKGRHSGTTLFLAGLYWSSCFLIRSNLVYLGPACIAWILIHEPQSLKIRFQRIMMFGLGSTILLLLLVLVYTINNQHQLLFQSLVQAPLAYVGASNPILEQWISFLKMIQRSFMSENLFIWISFLLGSIPIFTNLYPTKTKRILISMLLLIICCFWSIFQSNRTYQHYLIQLIPLLAIFSSSFLSSALQFRNKGIVLCLAVSLLLPFKPILWKYYSHAKKIQSHQSLFSDPGYQIVNYLKTQNVSNKPILILSTYHIAYWLTNAHIPTRYIHPSSLSKTYLMRIFDDNASLESELRQIWNQQPVVVIVEKKQTLKKIVRNNSYLYEMLDKNCHLANRITEIDIYKCN